MELTNGKRFFLNIFSAVLIIYGLTALPCVIVAGYLGESEAVTPLAIVYFACTFAGIIIGRSSELPSHKVHQRVNYFTTVMCWLILIALTTVVYYCARAEFTWADSIFEATAALTTTGTGNLSVNVYPYSMQLWRSLLNWIGGVGIILISVSCLSKWNFNGHSLVSIELPGPEFLKESIAFRKNCIRIILIYAALTAADFVLLCLAGMPAFTSLLTALSNISTAGLQHLENGVITGLPVLQKVIITIFAFLGSLNAVFFILIITRKGSAASRQTEVLEYTIRVLVTSVFICIVLTAAGYHHVLHSFGEALMQTISCLSTSGYTVSDCAGWPLICKMIILIQMFIGACAVSTSGGIKTSRIKIGYKTVGYGLFRQIHPDAVKPVRFNGSALSSDQLRRANMYIWVFMFIYILSALFLSLDNKNESILDALNYSQAMITNTGTSIGSLGDAGLATGFSPFSKLVMSFEMLCGRLEIYPVLMLFSRSFWKSEK